MDKDPSRSARDRPVSTWMLVVGTLVAAVLILLLVFDFTAEGRISGVFGAAALVYALLYITLIKQYVSPPEPRAGEDEDEREEEDLNGGSP